MTKQFAADVLIRGAGPAGLTLAIDLARRGVSFRLIEKVDDAFRGSRGKGVQPRTQEVSRMSASSTGSSRPAAAIHPSGSIAGTAASPNPM